MARSPFFLTEGPQVELDFDGVHNAFSSETWFDMQYIILRHTKSDLVLVKWFLTSYKQVSITVNS